MVEKRIEEQEKKKSNIQKLDNSLKVQRPKKIKNEKKKKGEQIRITIMLRLQALNLVPDLIFLGRIRCLKKTGLSSEIKGSNSEYNQPNGKE